MEQFGNDYSKKVLNRRFQNWNWKSIYAHDIVSLALISNTEYTIQTNKSILLKYGASREK